MFSLVRYLHIHRGVSLISTATSIRWVGWGVVDALIPIFLFSFASSYAVTGLLTSVYSLSFILVLPIVGMVANYIQAKYMILAGLLIYPFIGLSYYFAGLFGLAIFVVIARILNGISYALDATGRCTYIRRHTEREGVGKVFGFFEAYAHFWWILAIISSMVLVNYFEIYQLFLLVIPTSIIAFFIVLKVPKDKCDNKRNGWLACIQLASYGKFFREIFMWKKSLKRLAVNSFVLGIMFAFMDYFIPIYLYEQGYDLGKIILFTVIYSLPVLFSYQFGKTVDKFKGRVLPILAVLLALSLFAISFANTYALYILIAFIFSIVAMFISISIDAEMTRQGDHRRYGSLSSAILEIGEISVVIGPILTGLLIDQFGMQVALWILSAVTFSLVFLGSDTKKN